MIRKVACKYCGLEITRSLLERHYEVCPLSGNNLRRILIWIRDYIERTSHFSKIKIYPKAVEYNIFAFRNKILSYNSLRRIYPLHSWKEIIERLVEDGVRRNVVSIDDFPPYMRGFFSSTQFLVSRDHMYKVDLIDVEETAILKLRKDFIQDAERKNFAPWS